MPNEIQNFLSDLQTFSANKYTIVIKAREKFLAYDCVSEKFIYGGIGFIVTGFLVGGIYVSKNHVSIVFSRGNELKDPYGILEGEGQYRRHLKIHTVEELDSKKSDYYIKEVIKLELRTKVKHKPH